MKVRVAKVGDAEDIAHVHVESWRTTYKGIVPDTILAGLDKARRANYWRDVLENPKDEHRVFVAKDDTGNIVGFSSGGAERDEIDGYDGELYAIYLLKSAQGKGIGKQLFDEVRHYLIKQQFQKMALWVVADNPSRGFYEAVGGKYITEKTITIGDVNLVEAAYGWQLGTNTTT